MKNRKFRYEKIKNRKYSAYPSSSSVSPSPDFIKAHFDKPRRKNQPSKMQIYKNKIYSLACQIDSSEKQLWRTQIEISKILRGNGGPLYTQVRRSRPVSALVPVLNEVINEQLGHLIQKDKDFIPGIFSELKDIDISKASKDDVEKIYDIIYIIFEVVTNVGSKDGFLNTLDFSNPNVYPIFSDLIPALLDYTFKMPKSKKEGLVVNEKLVIKERRQDPIKFYKEIVSKSWEPKHKEQFFNWLINLVFLHLISISTSCYHKLEDEYDSLRIASKFNILIKMLKSRLDLDIRDKLKLKSIQITKVLHSGFDTEFQNIDIKKNKYLSTQTSCTAGIEIRIPKITNYNAQGVHTLSGEKYNVNNKYTKGLSESLINNIINSSVLHIRGIDFDKADKNLISIRNLMDKKVENKELVRVEKEDEILYLSPLYNFDNEIKIINENEEQKFESFINSLTVKYNNILNNSISLLIKEIQNNILVSDIVFKLDNHSIIESNLEALQSLESLRDLPYKNIDNKGDSIRINKSYKMDKLCISIKQKLNLFIHYSAADLLIFKNFVETYKKYLTIINKSFVTNGRRLVIDGWHVNIRDTILLTSAATPSLAQIAFTHGIAKVKISQEQIKNMESLLKEDPKLFESYAMMDSIITLTHGLYIRNFMLSEIHSNKIPLTLGSIARSYCIEEWRKENYTGYQKSHEYLLGQPSGSTPKALSLLGRDAININLFLASYKGGRNECFLYGREDYLRYGLEKESLWTDYDLISCYTTEMSILGDPDYDKSEVIDIEVFSKFSIEELEALTFNNYAAMTVSFKFPDNVKYPNIPVQVDKNISIYPKTGEATITLPEYLLAKLLGCDIKITQGFLIPFALKKSESNPLKSEIVKPFAFIKKLQKLRMEAKEKFGKGSAQEKMYKDIGNMIYGLCCQGLSNKRKYDLKTGTYVSLPGSPLSNPIISSAITALARCAVTEMMNNADTMGHRIVSVTTDGFVCDTDDLEAKLLTYKNQNGFNFPNIFLNAYRKARKDLGHKEVALEIKTAVKGINSWTTRGQLGMEPTFGNNKNIIAMTGYQRAGKSNNQLNDLVKESLGSYTKEINYMQKSLVGANETARRGGDVTMMYKDVRFRTTFDNKRIIETPDVILNKITNTTDIQEQELLKIKASKLQLLIDHHTVISKNGTPYIDFAKDGGLLLDTDPHKNIADCKAVRGIANRSRNTIYNALDFTSRLLPTLNTTSNISMRWLFSWFTNLGYLYITDIEFAEVISKLTEKRMTKKFVNNIFNYINALIARKSSFLPNSVPKNKISLKFQSRIKEILMTRIEKFNSHKFDELFFEK